MGISLFSILTTPVIAQFKVTVTTPDPNAGIYVENKLIGKGTAVAEVFNQAFATEVVLKEEGKKDRRAVIMNAAPTTQAKSGNGTRIDVVKASKCLKNQIYKDSLRIPAPVPSTALTGAKGRFKIGKLTSAVAVKDTFIALYRNGTGGLIPLPQYILVQPLYDTTTKMQARPYSESAFHVDLRAALAENGYIDTLNATSGPIEISAKVLKRQFIGIYPGYNVPVMARESRINEHGMAYSELTYMAGEEKISLTAFLDIEWTFRDATGKTHSFKTRSQSDPHLGMRGNMFDDFDRTYFLRTVDATTRDAIAYALVELQKNADFQKLVQ